MKFTVKDNFTEKAAALIADRSSKAEHIVALQAKADTEQYVPASGAPAGMYIRARVIGNTIIYPGPYAQFLYYGKVMVDPETGSTWAPYGGKKVVTSKDLVFTTDFHPQAQSHWFEASKAQNIDKWLRVAEKAVNRGE